ncbi:MAG: transposase [Pseudonocardiales bacterium]|nr:transposase [Pseudonocardiales bacterium]
MSGPPAAPAAAVCAAHSRWTGKPGAAPAAPRTRLGILMAAIDHHAGMVIGQIDVPGKTNAIPLFSQLCDQIADLEGVVVTADAMHCQTAHADYLVLARRAHYILPVKGNQPALRNQCRVVSALVGLSRNYGGVARV